MPKSKMPGVDWDVQPLGKMFDSELARKLGVSRERVRQVRERRGVESWHGKKIRLRDLELKSTGLVGKITDAALSRSTGIPEHRIKWYREKMGIAARGCEVDVDWESVDFSEKTDGEIASDYGVGHTTVAKNRRKLGILAANKSGPGFFGRKGINWDEQPLGEVPDGVIARKLAVSDVAVHIARKRRGIPSFTEQKGKRK